MKGFSPENPRILLSYTIYILLEVSLRGTREVSLKGTPRCHLGESDIKLHLTSLFLILIFLDIEVQK